MPAPTFTHDEGRPDYYEVFPVRVTTERLRDIRPLLEDLSNLLSSISQAAFKNQRLGTHRWPVPYAPMPSPRVNLAAALTDLNRGKRVQPKNIDDPTALTNSGHLRMSIRSGVVLPNRARVAATGPPASYAAKHQSKNRADRTSTIPVTPLARTTLAKQYAKAPKKLRKALGKLMFINHVDSLTTTAVRRPFLGIDSRGEADIREIIEEYFSSGST